MDTDTLLRILGLLLFYTALFVIIRLNMKKLDPTERKTFIVIAAAWAVSIFGGNYLCYLVGVMSFLPWVNNFMHTFLWIGMCLGWLYLGVRKRESMVVQFIVFATFSLIVKYAEQLLFGIWEHDHFFFLFQGNFAYVMGWSLADGLYPLITLFGLRLMSRWIPGLVAL